MKFRLQRTAKLKVLLTGGTGLVGRNVIERFSGEDGIELICPSREELDLMNTADVLSYVEGCRPDVIVHAAGLVGGIQANIAQPFSFLYKNLMIGCNVVFAAKEFGVLRLINLGSSCMYPKAAENPLREGSILGGALEPTNEGYAIAKISVAKLAEYCAQEFNCNYKTLIPCNLYGRFDNFDPQNSHMIPGVIRKIHEAKKNKSDVVEIWGDGSARREFMYAGDLADFIFFAVRHYDACPQVLNVGLGHDYNINEYYRAIAEVVGFKGDFVYDLSKPSGMKRKLCDISKLTSLGWRAEHSLESGLKKTYSYFLNEVNV